jgi:hypothetical protein
VYDTSALNWTFPGNWQWIDGYDYPVPVWQNDSPDAP